MDLEVFSKLLQRYTWAEVLHKLGLCPEDHYIIYTLFNVVQGSVCNTVQLRLIPSVCTFCLSQHNVIIARPSLLCLSNFKCDLCNPI